MVAKVLKDKNSSAPALVLFFSPSKVKYHYTVIEKGKLPDNKKQSNYTVFHI